VVAAAPHKDLCSQVVAWATVEILIPQQTSLCVRTRRIHRHSSGRVRLTKETKVGSQYSLTISVVILPSSALHELARLNISYPMLFMISNPQMGKKTYCGVLEFSAEEGMCYLPIWMMNNLFLEEGSDVMLRNVNLTKGKFVVLQPHETAFINLANPKAILENQLTNYSCLMKGDTINIHHSGKDYLIDIVDCKPADQICVVEADIEVDFREPLDFKEVQAKQMATPQAAARQN